MNNILSMTVFGWTTGNKSRKYEIIARCKDYGLVSIMRNVYAGELYAWERIELNAKIRSVLVGKREKFFFATMCKSCFNSSMVDMGMDQRNVEKPDFEILQMSRNIDERPKNR